MLALTLLSALQCLETHALLPLFEALKFTHMSGIKSFWTKFTGRLRADKSKKAKAERQQLLELIAPPLPPATAQQQQQSQPQPQPSLSAAATPGAQLATPAQSEGGARAGSATPSAPQVRP
jgi:hypothetical protein